MISGLTLLLETVIASAAQQSIAMPSRVAMDCCVAPLLAMTVGVMSRYVRFLLECGQWLWLTMVDGVIHFPIRI